MDTLYLTESMQKYWLNIFDEYLEEGYIPYSCDFDFWPEWLFKYYNKLDSGEAIGSADLMYNSEQNILTHKYDTMHSLEPLVKHYSVTME